MRAFALASLAVTVAVAMTACGAASAPPPAPAPPAASAAPLDGCAIDRPVLSDDACAADSDCAPATPCHAPRCVARANAAPRAPGTMCTQEMRCRTIDVGACACVSGKCALVARP